MKELTLPKRRAKQLDEIADYILNHGLADLSLRPLAAAIKTSPRMLLYCFGSKEQLIADALAHLRTREQRDFGRAVSESKPADRLESLLLHWRSWSAPGREKYSRLFFEVYGLALQNPKRFPGFLEHAVGDWLPLLEQTFAAAGLAPASAQTMATLAIGTVRGLYLNMLASGDRKGTEAAFREMLRLFSSAVELRVKSTGPEQTKNGSAGVSSSLERVRRGNRPASSTSAKPPC
jgi:AcrR family transcriptional regulator